MGNAIQATNKLQELLIIWKKEANIRSQVEGEAEVRILEELCKVGAHLNYLEQERGFALIPKVFWSKKLIQFFVDRGMNVNSQDEEGDTALHLVIRHANYEDKYDQTKRLVEFLLNDLNADPNVTNLRGKTALFEHANCIGTEVFFPPGYIRQKWEHRFQKGNKGKVAELLVERGAEVTTRHGNSDDESVLHKFDNSINTRIIQEFKGTDIDFRTSSWFYSKTPLMVAAMKNNSHSDEECLDNCRFLVEKGADVNARDLQGYIALHHAVLNSATECAEFLIERGADPNAKSISGKNVYDMNIRRKVFNFEYGEGLFTRGATPRKQVEILEIVGALMLMKDIHNDAKYAIKLWDQAIDIRKKINLQPTEEFLASYKVFVGHIRNSPDLKEPNDEIHLLAMNTVASLSEGTTAKFWNLISLPFWKRPFYVFGILNFLSEDLKDVEVFASLEEVDFSFLSDIVEFFKDWSKKLVELGESKNELTPERISHVHSIARLVIACFDKLTKLTHETNNNKLTGMCTKLYVKLCYVLTSLHSRFADVIPETAFNDNKILLKKLINMDMRDRDSNTLMHLVVKNIKTTNSYNNYNKVEFEFDLVATLLDDFESIIDIKTKNRKGFEPVQLINSNNYSQSLEDVFVKMADRGAHVDARNVGNGPTLRVLFEKEGRPELAFHYDNLQCACARVVARSLMPFRNKMPKDIVDFINMHLI